MNRKEEIEKYARECAANQVHCIEIDITHACEWADKTIIDKACEWLEEKLPIYWSQVNANDTEEFIDKFKKAMEG